MTPALVRVLAAGAVASPLPPGFAVIITDDLWMTVGADPEAMHCAPLVLDERAVTAAWWDCLAWAWCEHLRACASVPLDLGGPH